MGFSTVVTPDDLKIGELVPPGWFDSEISSYEEKPASTDKSTNCIFHFKILDGQYKGYQGRLMLNEKALGMGKELYKALDFPFDPEKGYKLSSELFRQTVGSKLSVYFKRGKSDRGTEFNDPSGFKPLGVK